MKLEYDALIYWLEKQGCKEVTDTHNWIIYSKGPRIKYMIYKRRSFSQSSVDIIMGKFGLKRKSIPEIAQVYKYRQAV